MNYRQKVGKFGEELAEKYLIKNGYKIIDRNVKISYQEIDIIAKIKEKIVLVEVKTISSELYRNAEENLSRRKINNLNKALNIYADKKGLEPDKIRVDLVAVNINKYKKSANIKHYKDIY